MSSFTTPLIVKIHVKNPQEREIYVPFTYVTNDGRTITAPKGFFTNFASTPKFLWEFLPPLDHYGKAAVIHDYLYRTPGLGYTKAESDLILKEACENLGVKKWKIDALYYAVKLFGFHAWNKQRKFK